MKGGYYYKMYITNERIDISHLKENVKPFSENSFLFIKAQNKENVKGFTKKISEFFKTDDLFEKIHTKLVYKNSIVIFTSPISDCGEI